MEKKKVKLKKKKVEWSKIVSGTIAFGFGIFALWCGTRYYDLTLIAIESGSDTLPDVTLAVTAMSVVIGALLSYLLYQLGLKNSRNKYGIDENGEPFKIKLEDDECSEESNE